MWHPDDDVWHERALLYPVGKRGCKLWVIGTPDWAEADGSGIYIERIEEGDDIDSVQPLAWDGSRPFLDDDIYAFSVPLSNTEVLDLIKDAKVYAHEYLTAAALSFDRPTEYVEWSSGKVIALPPSFRLRGKGAGDRPASHGGRADGPARGPAVVPAGRWCLASPLPGMAIGDFVEWDPKDTWVKLGNSVLLEFDSGPAAGHLALLEKVEGSGSEGGPTLRRKLRAEAIEEFGLLDPEANLPPLKEKPGAPGAADPPKEVDDARACCDAQPTWAPQQGLRRCRR